MTLPLFNKAFHSVAVLQTGSAAQRLACKLACHRNLRTALSSYPVRLLALSDARVPATTSRESPVRRHPPALVSSLRARPGVPFFTSRGPRLRRSIDHLPGRHPRPAGTETRAVLPVPRCGFRDVNARTAMHSRMVLRNRSSSSARSGTCAHLNFRRLDRHLRGRVGTRDHGRQAASSAAGSSMSRSCHGTRATAGGGDLYHARCPGQRSAGRRGRPRAGRDWRLRPAETGSPLLFGGWHPRPVASRHHGRHAAPQAGGDAGVPGAKARVSSVVLTNCPSCVQGLARNRSLGDQARAPAAVALAEKTSGPRWQEEAVAQVTRGSAISF